MEIKQVREFIKHEKIGNLEVFEFLGSGSYGSSWSGKFHGFPVAVKVEQLNDEDHASLYQEFCNYKALGQVVDITQPNWKYSASRFSGLAKCLLYHSAYGKNSSKNISRLNLITDSQDTRQQNDSDCSSSTYLKSKHSMHMLILTRFGDNLKNVVKEHPQQRFSIEATTKLAITLLKVIEYVHSNGIVNRDIKPSNILIPYFDKHDDPETIRRKKHCVYLIDFGLAKPWKFKNTEGQYEHIPQCKKSSPCGTLSFLSPHAHSCSEASRRDDLGSLAYVLIHVANGKLPWDSYTKDTKYLKKKLRITNKKQLSQARNHLVYKMKREIPSKELCKGLPLVFTEFVDYCKNLQFEEKPQYKYWIERFNQVLLDMGTSFKKTSYDWIDLNKNCNDDEDEDTTGTMSLLGNIQNNNINNHHNNNHSQNIHNNIHSQNPQRMVNHSYSTPTLLCDNPQIVPSTSIIMNQPHSNQQYNQHHNNQQYSNQPCTTSSEHPSSSNINYSNVNHNNNPQYSTSNSQNVPNISNVSFLQKMHQNFFQHANCY